MGLIYVNPEGPNGNPDPIAAARDIRDTFGRMSMNDEETVALIAGGHTFGKGHGAACPDKHVGPEPAGASIAEQSLGWKNDFGSGAGEHTITSGLEGAWTPTPTTWDNTFFDVLFGFDWELTKTPAGAQLWKPKNNGGAGTVPDAHNPDIRHNPIMFTTDLSLREDPVYAKISKRFHENPEEFSEAFSRAWFKLTHRDMGPKNCYIGNDIPSEEHIWQDPVPTVDHPIIDESDTNSLKETISKLDLTAPQLVSTAWASASTFRGSDKRGGANGARIRLAPQKYWEINNPAQLSTVLDQLETVQTDFNNSQSDGKKVSLADLIVLAGSVGLESITAEKLMVDRAQLLTLTAPEMTVLLGGLRVIGINQDGSQNGVFTDKPGTLTNDFFVNLLDLSTTWKETSPSEQLFEGRNRKTGELKYTGTRVDLIFGSNSELRAIAEVYATQDSNKKFITDFIAAWHKVMNLDRFDLIK